jgi:hypothetical protein
MPIEFNTRRKAAAAAAAAAVFTFPAGDVKITVLYNNELVTGYVESDSMALASPVWKKFIFPPWGSQQRGVLDGTSNNDKERTKLVNTELAHEEQEELLKRLRKMQLDGSDEEQGRSMTKNDKQNRDPIATIDFCDDDGEALLILLRLAHSRTEGIPFIISYKLFLNIAILVDQYDCINLVRPWIGTWFCSVEVLRAKNDGHLGWFFVNWVFGQKDAFKNFAEKLVNEMEISDTRNPIASFGEVLNPVPPGILESILAARLDAITKLLEIPYSKVANFENDRSAFCKADSDPACSARTYDFLLQCLQKNNLWPRKDPREICTSVKNLASIIKEISNTLLYHRHGSIYGDFRHDFYHDLIIFDKEVDKVTESIPSPVLESHLRHIALQNPLDGSK